jgi:hypothetical protein
MASIVPNRQNDPRYRQRLVYDPIDGVIHVDLSDLHATSADVDGMAEAVIAMASGLAKRPYLLVCWRGALMDSEASRRYAARIGDLTAHVRAIVRYQALDAMNRVLIRTETIKRRLQNSRAFIFDTRQDALHAIRSGAIEEQLSQSRG